MKMRRKVLPAPPQDPSVMARQEFESVQRKLAGQPCSLFHVVKRKVQCAYEWWLDKPSMLSLTRWTSPEFTAAHGKFCVELSAAATATEASWALMLLSPQNLVVEGQLSLTALVSGGGGDHANHTEPAMFSLCRSELLRSKCRYDMERASMPFAPSVPRSVLLAVDDRARMAVRLTLVVSFKHFTPEKSLLVPATLDITQPSVPCAPDLSLLLAPSPPLADVALVCQGEQVVPAHSVLLAARTRIWADEKHPSTIGLREFDQAIVMHLLYFVYTGTVAGNLTSADQALDLLRLACRFQLEQLALLCVRALGLHIQEHHLSRAIDGWVACRRGGLHDVSLHLAAILRELVSSRLTEAQAAQLLSETESLHTADLPAECKGSCTTTRVTCMVKTSSQMSVKHSWKVDQFAALPDHTHNSADFTGGKGTWFLELCPYGWPKERSDTLSTGLYLRLRSSRTTRSLWVDMAFTVTDGDGHLIDRKPAVGKQRFRFQRDRLRWHGWRAMVPRAWLAPHASLTISVHMDVHIGYELQASATASALSIPRTDTRQTLCHDLALLQRCQERADVHVRSGDGRVFSAHRVLLAAQSPVFLAMLRPHNPMQEAQTGWIEMRDADGETVARLLDHVYSGQCAFDTTHLAEHLALLRLADKYALAGLARQCVAGVEKMCASSAMRPQCALEVLRFARLHSLSEFAARLEQAVASYAAQHLPCVLDHCMELTAKLAAMMDWAHTTPASDMDTRRDSLNEKRKRDLESASQDDHVKKSKLLPAAVSGLEAED